MKELIVYKSNTGFTKKYIESLNRRLDDPKVVDVKKLKKKDLKEAKYIFYGGPLRNNKILGLDKLLKHYELIEDKNIFVFCTGIEPINGEKKENVISANGLMYYHVRLYLLPGGLDISKMPKTQQFLMKKGMNIAAKREGVSVDLLASRLNNAIDLVDLTKLDKIIDVYRKVKLKDQFSNEKDI